MLTPKTLGDLLYDGWETDPAAESDREAFGCPSCRFGLEPSRPTDLAKLASVTCPRGHAFTLQDRLAIWNALFAAAGYEVVRSADVMTEADDPIGVFDAELYDLAEAAARLAV